MVKTIVLTVAGSIAVAWLTVLGLAPASAFTPQTVSTFAGASSTAVLAASYTGAPPSQVVAKTYAAFTAWEAHPTRANMDTLVTDSFRLPAKYDAADIAQLYADVMGGAKATTISDDEGYIYQDLTGSGL